MAAGDVAGMTISQLSVVSMSSSGLKLLQTLVLDSSMYSRSDCFGPVLSVSNGRVAMLCDHAVVEVRSITL